MKKKRRMATFVFLFAVGWLSYLGVYHLSHYDTAIIQKQLGFLVVVSAFLPTLFYLWKLITGQPVDPIPFLPVMGVIYAFYYGMPAMSAEPLHFRFEPIPPDVMEKSYQVALAGWWALLSGFYLLGKIIKVKPFHFPLENDTAAKKMALRFLCVGLLSELLPRFFHLPSALGQVPLLLNNFLPLGLGIMIILSLKGSYPKGSLIEKILWLFVLPIFLLLKLSSGLLSTLIFPLLFIFILFWIFSPKFHYLWVGIILLPLLILLKGSIGEYRTAAWYGEKKGLSSFEKSKLLIDITQKRILRFGLKSSFEESKKGVKERSSQIVTLMRVIDQTPQYIAYWKGETYKTLLYTFIPRILWPSKPVKDLGQRFGHCYNFLDDQDTATSVNLPQLTEFYMNFGMPGVFIGMTVLGVLYRFLYGKLNRFYYDDGTLLVGSFIFMNLINIESDLSLVVAGMVYQILVLFFTRKLIR